MNITYLPHTADIRMKIESSTVEQLFIAGMIGMGNILKKGFCDKDNPIDCKSKIEIHAMDQTCLFIDFLSNILSHSYADKSIYCKVEFSLFTSNKIKADIFGTHTSKLDEEIKAVTYHEAQVHKNRNHQWETLVVFDI